MTRKTDYLFKRRGSQNWWVKFQYTGDAVQLYGRKVEKSLGTTDRKEAQIRALPLIAEHRRKLQVFDNLRNGRSVVHRGNQGVFKVGEHADEGGYFWEGTVYARYIATEEKVFWIDAEGRIVRTMDNPRITIINHNFDRATVPHNTAGDLTPTPLTPTLKPKRASNESDEKIIDTWAKHNAVDPRTVHETKGLLATFHGLSEGRTIATATRADGRKLADHLRQLGLKSGTIGKKVGYLRSAVNLAITDGVVKFNPFSGVVPKKVRDENGNKVSDSVDRLPLDDDDMAAARARLHNLRSKDQLLWKLLAQTGMRLSEPFQIREEHQEGRVRYVMIGEKTESSKRRVPIPTDVLSLLPAKIKGPIFPDCSAEAIRATGKRMGRFLRACGISALDAKGEERKVLHSLRHRAKDRLRAVGCPKDIRDQIVGHESTVAEDYGLGHPVPVLKDWIEKIGY